jgi:hypothetical protein
LLPIRLRLYHHLHPFSQVESSIDERIDENKNLDVFEMVAITTIDIFKGIKLM